ncbi:glutathione S-transferase family protein [Pokkaliibacter sp. CJK22405]|uniref:glutathione S-transferase family protein n=1 Tax=Pokkaliibacter sp. CJK22405 TaxID=3384615 RepID=UPI003984B23A
MMKLYGMCRSGNAYKVRLMMEQEGIPYEWHEVDILGGETRSQEFLKINPLGKVPVLEIAPGEFLYESNAILTFLARGTHYWPDPAYPHAKAMEWMFFEQTLHLPALSAARWILNFLPEEHPRHAELPGLHERGYRALAHMESRLAEHEFLVGKHYSIADTALYAYTHMADQGGFDLTPFPGIRAWIKRITEIPGYIGIDTPVD